jgi:hypothetical protein
MSHYDTKTVAQRRAWGAKMQAAKAAKNNPILLSRKKKAPTRRAAGRRVIRGRGDYYDDAADVYQQGRDYVKTPKSERGFGESLGRNVGGFVGKGIQQLVKNITGFGDYNVSNNSLMSGGLSPPQIVNSSNHGGFIVRHREYLKDINATTAFALESFPLNPGISSTFPWLSTVANAFEQYKFRGIVFEIKSLASDSILSASTSSALGSVIMATEYNSLNSNFANKNEMENHEFANSRKPSEDFMHPIECKRSLTSVDLMYIRSGSVPVGGDIRLYDLGKTEIATVGMQAASGVCSELWITYEVELYKPQLASGAIDDLETKTDHYIFTAGVSGTTPFGSVASPTPVVGSNIGGTLSSVAGASRYTFPQASVGDKYLIYYQMKGDTTVAVASPGYTIVGSAAVPSLFMNDSPLFQSFSSPEDGGAAATKRWTFIIPITILAAGAYFQFTTAGTLPNTNTVADLFIIRYAPTILGSDEDETAPPVEEADESIEDEDEIPDAIKRFLLKKGIKL